MRDSQDTVEGDRCAACKDCLTLRIEEVSQSEQGKRVMSSEGNILCAVGVKCE